MKLNLGCGRNMMDGWVNVDTRSGDVFADATALPFRDSAFDEVLASHVLEHIPDLGAAMREIHRILGPRGILHVIAPYGLKKLYDPFHYHAFDFTTLEYFCREDSSLDAAPLFRIVNRSITDYRMPMKWHLHRYLPFLKLTHQGSDGRTRTRLPLGPRSEVTFWLARRSSYR